MDNIKETVAAMNDREYRQCHARMVKHSLDVDGKVGNCSASMFQVQSRHCLYSENDRYHTS